MALTFFWRCEGTTLDGTHDYSAGDTTATATGAVTIDAAGAKLGSNGIVTVNATDYYTFDSASIADIDQGAIGFWIQWKTAKPAAGLVTGFSIRDAATGFQALQLQTSGTDELRFQIRNSGGTLNLITGAANLAIDTWYFVICRWHLSSDKRAIEVYNSAGALVDSNEDLATDLSTYVPSAVDSIQLGNRSSDTNPMWMDSVMIGSTYAEPLEDYLAYTSYTQTNSDLIDQQVQFYRAPNTLLRM